MKINFRLVTIFVLIDQLLKQWLVGKDFVVFNTGIAWGINLPQPFLVLALYLTIGWLAWLVGREAKRKNKSTRLMIYTLVFGGAVSNALDRIVRGAVVDYIPAGPFPSFNIADIMIVGGIGWYLFDYFRARRSAAATTFSSK